MSNRVITFVFMAGIGWLTGCVKETYNMDLFSGKAHLSPTLAISAVKGDVTFSDIVKSGDTVVYGSDNFVTLIFRRESAIDIRPSDFTPVKLAGTDSGGTEVIARSGGGSVTGTENAYMGQWMAKIRADTIDLGIKDVLSHITGTLLISDPLIKFTYTNSFVDPIQIDFQASGIRQANSVNLNLAPFGINHPADTLALPVSSEFVIDKTNSALQTIMSMPPEMIVYSGKAFISVASEHAHNDLYTDRSLLGSVEVDIPLRLRADNLQYADTANNFLADAFHEGSSLSWEDFKLFRVDFDVQNGFPFGVSIQMDLVDSLSNTIISTIESPDVLTPAPVDQNGKSSSVASGKASLTFTQDFFNSIARSDKIIFRFIMNTTDNGSRDVKIYSDYRLAFKASLIVKPDIKFEL